MTNAQVMLAIPNNRAHIGISIEVNGVSDRGSDMPYTPLPGAGMAVCGRLDPLLRLVTAGWVFLPGDKSSGPPQRLPLVRAP